MRRIAEEAAKTGDWSQVDHAVAAIGVGVADELLGATSRIDAVRKVLRLNLLAGLPNDGAET